MFYLDLIEHGLSLLYEFITPAEQFAYIHDCRSPKITGLGLITLVVLFITTIT